MSAAKVGSREYKVMLNPARFAGAEDDLLGPAREFWRTAARVLGPAVLFTSGDLDRVKARRLIRFYDTPDRHLNRNAYILRDRLPVEGRGREVTLKFRHPDRFIARARDMSAGGKGKTKFEEDIKPPFQQLYSYSTTTPVDPEHKLAALKDAMKLFPGLRRSLTGFSADAPLAPVDDFTAREVVIGGAALHLGKKYNVAAGCVLVIWYDHARGGNPVAAEFSYKYGDNDEQYGAGTVRRAFDVFQLLQTGFDGWVDPASKTKTAFAYTYAADPGGVPAPPPATAAATTSAARRITRRKS
jgi:hypothetical protein